jgi:hypothetical protein
MKYYKLTLLIYMHAKLCFSALVLLCFTLVPLGEYLV